MWVIAETKDLPTNFIKIVVTDDRGRFVLPELPTANYKVWVRGYGIVDSSPIEEKPGSNNVSLKVTSAKTPQEAAKVYPGNYWLSLMEPPDKSLFPGTGTRRQRRGNGHADPEPLDQLARSRTAISAISWATQLTRDRGRRAQSQAGVHDRHAGLGMAAGLGRSRHQHVFTAEPAWAKIRR